MYKINSVRIMTASENLNKKSTNLEYCLERLRFIENNLSSLNGDAETRYIVRNIYNKMSQQKTNMQKISHVLSTAAQAAADGNRNTLMICSHETELKKNLVANMLGHNNRQINQKPLPIKLEVNIRV